MDQRFFMVMFSAAAGRFFPALLRLASFFLPAHMVFSRNDGDSADVYTTWTGSFDVFNGDVRIARGIALTIILFRVLTTISEADIIVPRYIGRRYIR